MDFRKQSSAKLYGGIGLSAMNAAPLVRETYREPPQPQLQACLRVVEDVLRRRTAQVARATLLQAIDGLHDTVAHFVWEARQVMRSLVPMWLARASGNMTVDVIDDEAERNVAKVLAAQQLSAIEALVDDGSDPTRANSSIYSWRVRYLEDRKALLVPPGLLGLFLDASPMVEPVLVPLLGRPLLRELMPTRQGPYAWRRRHERRLEAFVNCIAPGLDVAGTPQDIHGLATETALESGVLEPLLVLYSRRLREESGRPTRLHHDYSNAELFFVLWALGHCGGRNAAVLVNGALRNFAPFARTFRCTVNQAMWSGHRCPFWH
ncbi:hypothetical protein V5799_024444 [Amblyomma americanum]|uniref:Uncharacterized protein n=2 Tax=Amblyomma americanum TaxID=6943 RepID=A0AAQ4ECJ3_AMBAM